jgi:hypothetical protein
LPRPAARQTLAASPSIRTPIRLQSNRRSNCRNKTRTRRSPASSPDNRDNPEYPGNLECRHSQASPLFQDSLGSQDSLYNSPRIPTSRVNLNIHRSRGKTQGSRSNILGSLHKTQGSRSNILGSLHKTQGSRCNILDNQRNIRDSRHNSQGKRHIKLGSRGLLPEPPVFLELPPAGPVHKATKPRA